MPEHSGLSAGKMMKKTELQGALAAETPKGDEGHFARTR